MTVPSAKEFYRALFQRGWSQGTLFEAPTLTVPHQQITAQQPRQLNDGRVMRARERLILATHPCDVVSPDEPIVEALVCADYSNKPELCSRADGKSARFFLVDPVQGLVAVAMHRVLIAKKSLDQLTPLGWPSDETRRRRFSRWLGRRFDRPALPDNLDRLFRAVLDEALAAFQRDEPAATAAVNGVCND